MNQWTSSSSPQDNQIWRRPLGIGEASFYWDAVLDGSFDAMQYEEVELDEARLDVMTVENIRNAWLAVKRRHPLIATRILRLSHDQLYFEVSEERVCSIADGELVIKSRTSKDEVAAFNEKFLSGPRQLSSEMNVRVFISPSDDNTNPHKRGSARFHIWMLSAHSISDGAANMGLFTTFMTMLTTPYQRITTASIAERLAMVPDGEILHYKPTDSVARRRWWKAIAFALLHVREAQIKGGHVFPNKIQPERLLTPPAPRAYGVYLDPSQTNAIMRNCRVHGMPLGSAVAPLSQIAHARVLHRRRHTMQPNEWDRIIREPMHYAGPLSRRPRMPEEWQQGGGLTEYCMLIGPYQCTLPRMPSSRSSNPTYGELLSRKAFWNRCLSVKKQTDAYANHPLFHEMNAVRFVGRLEDRRKCAKLWEKKQRGKLTPQDITNLAEYLQSFPFAISSFGSSFGSMEEAIGKNFPVPSHGKSNGEILEFCSSTPGVKPFLVVRNMETFLRSIPATMYLTVMGNFGRLWVGCWWDGNTFDDDLVKEWVDEIAGAADFYLCERRGRSTTSDVQARL